MLAEEIRKLANRTNGSVKEVTDTLSMILASTKDLCEHIHQVAAVAEEQSASTEEISASLNSITHIAKQLKDIAVEITK